MKKKLFILAVVGLMVCLVGSVAIAGGQCGHPWNPNHGYLYLYQKVVPTDVVCIDPYDPAVTYSSYPCSAVNDQNWSIPRRGARGKLEYRFSGPIFKFEFEGHGLDRGVSYTLIYYPDNMSPGSGLIYFGSDVADKHGNVHIQGSLDTGDLPASYDDNCINKDPITGCCGEGSGAKIWLVPSSNVWFRGGYAPYLAGIQDPEYPSDPSKRIWNLDMYLFEDELINFDSPGDRDCP